jgi:serine/threonine protein kinase
MVCLKIIENNKDYFDQSIDEIKLLKFINLNCDPDEKNVLKMHDCFYHKEHLFIVTELLRDNLYEFSRYNRENEDDIYFTIGRLQKIASQLLSALEYIHSLHLIHCDLKPENILIKSYSRCEVKIIDFGSSCFIHDHLSSYVQSRSYRAPEVILGCKYDYKIDIWSLGCIIAELFTGNVLFQNDTVQGLLSRVIGIIGPLPDEMFKTGRLVGNFFTKEKLLFVEDTGEDKNKHLSEEMAEILKKKKANQITIMVPKRTSLKARLRSDDAMFLDFIRCLLELDKDRRPSAKEALRHPWITECKYVDGLP